MTAYRVSIRRLPDPPQPTLFAAKPLRPIMPSRAPAADRARLSDQCERILDRLRRGNATNGQLAEIALNYRARVSELRAAGYTIICSRSRTGLGWYRLVDNAAP